MKILLIEDEKDICSLYQDILSSNGYQVNICNDGESGFLAAEVGDYDILLLDIMLPGMDGLDILRGIHKKGLTSTKKVVILTNIEKQDVLKSANSMGAQRYIIKSEVNPSQLVDIISAL